MAQLTFGDAEHAGKAKKTRKESFLAEMDQVVHLASLLMVIAPLYPEAGNGRRPNPLPTMLREAIGAFDSQVTCRDLR